MQMFMKIVKNSSTAIAGEKKKIVNQLQLFSAHNLPREEKSSHLLIKPAAKICWNTIIIKKKERKKKKLIGYQLKKKQTKNK